MSIERVRPVPGAVALLEVCAFPGPEEIPRVLFGQQLDVSSGELAVLADDPFALDEGVGGLRRFGLIKASDQTLTVHRLVQQVIRSQLTRKQQRHRAAAVLRLVQAAFPSDPVILAAGQPLRRWWCARPYPSAA